MCLAEAPDGIKKGNSAKSSSSCPRTVAKPTDAEQDTTQRAHFNDDMRIGAPSTLRMRARVAFIYSLIFGGRLCVNEALKCASSVACDLSRCGSLRWAHACSLMWHERVAFIYSIGGCRLGVASSCMRCVRYRTHACAEFERAWNNENQ